ncbi:hypothetical protein T4E_8698 [Trichinella pseudospiralis]|uniref:Uncharacterized protein n=1 Tax=Trichinella pseudospiralis TaxID=6337 RepID=A0A0V0YIG9_TRIPS|nr:hypothetical protein T4E_8698 [Trichinella pseudospiralis]
MHFTNCSGLLRAPVKGGLFESEERRKDRTSPKKWTCSKQSNGVSIMPSAAALLASITKSGSLEPGDFHPVIRKNLSEAP